VLLFATLKAVGKRRWPLVLTSEVGLIQTQRKRAETLNHKTRVD
jgi:hypothetical protein